MRKTTTFRRLLEQPGPNLIPGVYDALSAALAEQVGFGAVSITGAGLSVTHGYPDLGIMTLTEVVERTRAVVRGTSLPVMVDADTGYGGVLNVARTVVDLQAAGAAALHLEDQVTQKKCGLLDGIEVVSVEEMLARIRAALDARTDPDFCVVARTDARASGDLDDVITRANAYRQAGADATFLFDLHSRQELETAAREIAGPIITHVSRGGRVPPIPPAELADMGYAAICYPLTPLQAAAHATRAAMEHIRDDARLTPLFDRMVAPIELYELVGLSRAQKFAQDHEPEGNQ